MLRRLLKSAEDFCAAVYTHMCLTCGKVMSTVRRTFTSTLQAVIRNLRISWVVKTEVAFLQCVQISLFDANAILCVTSLQTVMRCTRE